MADEITCKRCGKPGLPPTDVTWGGEIGDVIRTTICQTCWREWEEMSVKVVNEYRLSMANPEHYRLFVDQLKSFLGMETEGDG